MPRLLLPLAALVATLLAARVGVAAEPCAGCRSWLPEGDGPVPLLVTLHGDGQPVATIHDAWKRLAAARGIAVLSLACPADLGCKGSWWQWDGDPGWILQQVAKLDAVRRVDRDRLWVAGWSGGASYIGWRSAFFEAAFAAVVVHGGGIPPSSAACDKSNRAPVYFLVGDKNPLHSLAVHLRDRDVSCGDPVVWDLVRGADHAGEWAALATHGANVVDWLVSHPRALASASTPAPLACLARHYAGAPVLRDGRWSLALADGSTIPYERAFSDGSADATPSVKDAFELVYRPGTISPIVDPEYDPGRVRLESLMRATYGASASEVESSLVVVRVRGVPFRVHRRIAEPLRRVAARLEGRPRTDPALRRAFEKPGGTFNWRTIAGTRALSMHAWGIAIDLDPAVGDYWRNEPEATRAWKNRMPQAIVDAFEAEGFIWGGRWFHFDTMHFEYRPELLDPACYPPRGG